MSECLHLLMKFLIVLILFQVLGTAEPVFALNSFTCQSNLITLNSNLSEVLLRCGDPHKRTTWQEAKETQKTVVSNSTIPTISEQHIVTKSSQEQKSVEELVYNFGSSDFLYILRFENGKLIKIDTSGYGF